MKLSLKTLLFAGLAAFTVGCDKDEDSGSPDKGTVKGSVSPANSASNVYLITGTDTIKSTPATDGSYELKNVNPGTYTLAFKAAANFDTPANSTVDVKKGQTTNVPVVTMAALPPNGLISVDIEGFTYSGTPSYFAGNDYPLYISGNGYPNNYNTGHQISFEFPVITGVGTYTTQNSTGDDIEIIIFHKNDNWWSTRSMGTATINVTSFNPTTKRMSGTFSFTAENSGFPDKVGTNGIIKNVRLVQ